MRLLIAEDELDLAEALSVLFEKNQFSVDVVNDGLSAYDYASGGDYDAVILDVMMPGLNGLEVLRRLREEGVKTPVMMLTAKGSEYDKVSGLDAGAQRVGQQRAVGLLLALPGLGEAAEQQREDDAGVAPGTLKQSGGGDGGCLPHGGGSGLAQRLGSGGDGHGHIGARVTVRHGEYI